MQILSSEHCEHPTGHYLQIPEAGYDPMAQVETHSLAYRLNPSLQVKHPKFPDLLQVAQVLKQSTHSFVLASAYYVEEHV